MKRINHFIINNIKILIFFLLFFILWVILLWFSFLIFSNDKEKNEIWFNVYFCITSAIPTFAFSIWAIYLSQKQEKILEEHKKILMENIQKNSEIKKIDTESELIIQDDINKLKSKNNL